MDRTEAVVVTYVLLIAATLIAGTMAVGVWTTIILGVSLIINGGISTAVALQLSIGIVLAKFALKAGKIADIKNETYHKVRGL